MYKIVDDKIKELHEKGIFIYRFRDWINRDKPEQTKFYNFEFEVGYRDSNNSFVYSTFRYKYQVELDIIVERHEILNHISVRRQV